MRPVSLTRRRRESRAGPGHATRLPRPHTNREGRAPGRARVGDRRVVVQGRLATWIPACRAASVNPINALGQNKRAWRTLRALVLKACVYPLGHSFHARRDAWSPPQEPLENREHSGRTARLEIVRRIPNKL